MTDIRSFSELVRLLSPHLLQSALAARLNQRQSSLSVGSVLGVSQVKIDREFGYRLDEGREGAEGAEGAEGDGPVYRF